MGEVKEMYPQGQGLPQQKVEKPTYEQIMQANTEMYQQLTRLAQENQMLKNNQAIIRVNILFEILKARELFPKDVVDKAVNEIVTSIYQPEPQEETQEVESAN